MSPSRRDLIELHARDPLKLRRCPVCLGVIEADQDEAIVMHGVWRRLQALVDSREPEVSVPMPDEDFSFAQEDLVAVGA